MHLLISLAIAALVASGASFVNAHLLRWHTKEESKGDIAFSKLYRDCFVPLVIMLFLGTIAFDILDRIATRVPSLSETSGKQVVQGIQQVKHALGPFMAALFVLLQSLFVKSRLSITFGAAFRISISIMFLSFVTLLIGFMIISSF